MSRVSGVIQRFTQTDPLAETDWSRFEHEVGRAMKADEPNACPHYSYPMPDAIYYSPGPDGEAIALCRHCMEPF